MIIGISWDFQTLLLVGLTDFFQNWCGGTPGCELVSPTPTEGKVKGQRSEVRGQILQKQLFLL